MLEAACSRPGGPARPRRERGSLLDSIARVRSTRLATRALAVLTLTASGLLAPLGAAPASAVRTGQRLADETTATPLSITMTLLTPSTIPTRGLITISGRVQNDSDEEWTDINVSPFVSSEPITTRDELAEAAAIRLRRRRSASGCPTKAWPNRSVTWRPVPAPTSRSACPRPSCRSAGTRASTGSACTRWAPARPVETWWPTAGRARSSPSCRTAWPASARCPSPSYSRCATAPVAPPTAA